MNWFPFYTADFIAATIGLSYLERSSYTLMLVMYYELERPLPLEPKRCYRLLGAESDEQRQAIDHVLQEFFVRAEDGWYNERAEQEIGKSRRLQGLAREKGIKSGISRRAAAELRLNSGSAAVEPPTPTPTPTPRTTPKTRKDVSSRERSPDESPVVESLLLRDGTSYQVRQSAVTEFEAAYPRTDVVATIKEMRAWLLANPGRRKTRTGCLRFVNRWLADEEHRISEEG